MDVVFHKTTYDKVRMVYCIYSGVTVYNFQDMYFSLKIEFVLANSADSDKISHYVAFHPGLHCLPKYLLGVSGLQRVNCDHEIHEKVLGGLNSDFWKVSP